MEEPKSLMRKKKGKANYGQTTLADLSSAHRRLQSKKRKPVAFQTEFVISSANNMGLKH